MNLFSPPEWVEQTFKDTQRGILSVCALDPICNSEEWHNQTAEIEQKASLILMENEDCVEFYDAKTHYDIGISGLVQLRNQIEYWLELALWCDPKDLELTDWNYIESQLQHCWNLVQDAVSKLPAVSTVHNIGKIEGVIRDIKDTYLDASTDAPWRMGISWGKDSTSMLQLTLEALNRIPKENWIRPIYLTTSDTHLELPPMLNIIRKNTHDFQQYIEQAKIPFEVKVVEPNLEERFFTNLIGKGYTTPLGGPVKRWCTTRLKIKPQQRLDKELLNNHGSIISILGTRYDESVSREISMKKWEGESRYGYTKDQDVLSYTPIAMLTTEQVWDVLGYGFLWGNNYQILKELYEASMFEDSGGRMGCSVCFVVKKDKSLENLANNGFGWLKPLLDFRDFVKEIETNKLYREPIPIDRRTALPTTRKARNPEKVTMGGINQRGRQLLLNKLLDTQAEVLNGMNQAGFEVTGGYELISAEEIIWIKSWWHHLSGYTEPGFTPLEVVSKPQDRQITLF